MSPFKASLALLVQTAALTFTLNSETRSPGLTMAVTVSIDKGGTLTVQLLTFSSQSLPNSQCCFDSVDYVKVMTWFSELFRTKYACAERSRLSKR